MMRGCGGNGNGRGQKLLCRLKTPLTEIDSGSEERDGETFKISESQSDGTSFLNDCNKI